MMNVGPTFYSFTIDSVLNEVVLCHILYLHQKMEFLNSCRAVQAFFKDCLTVNSDMYCFNLTVAFSNKKKKNMENWRSLL